eukprot:2940051-Pleurochrysis_carterae.AAC.1
MQAGCLEKLTKEAGGRLSARDGCLASSSKARRQRENGDHRVERLFGGPKRREWYGRRHRLRHCSHPARHATRAHLELSLAFERDH